MARSGEGGGAQWRLPGAAKRGRARSGGRGGEDEVARGRGWRRTGERPGGIVVQGGRGVEAAELGRRSGTAAEQEARWARRWRHGADQENACWRKTELSEYIRGPPFILGEATTRDKRTFCPGWWLHPGQKGFFGGPGKFPARGPPLVPGGSTTRDKRGPFSLLPAKSYVCFCFFLLLF